MEEIDAFFMAEALKEAEKAGAAGEIPVGAVIVKDGKIIAKAGNTREREQIATGHAEINAINLACRALSSWRLESCTMYVTLEPCHMCGGAIINARISRLVYGASDSLGGCMGSAMDLTKLRGMGSPKIKKAVLNSQCEEILKSFFDELR
ncbi:MAG: nucleoside deaminase [Oscillospiraceae bacterium]